MTGLRTLPDLPTLSVADARVLLKSRGRPAAVYHAAMRALVGYDVDHIDPDALRLVLGAADLALPQETYDKIFAVGACRHSPALVTARPEIFDVVVSALCGEPVLPGVASDLTAAQMAWGAEEAALYINAFSPAKEDLTGRYLWERGVRAYMAAELFEEGFVVAPPGLDFLQPELDMELSPATAPLAQKIRAAWSRLDPETVPDLDMETDVGVHLEKMLRVTWHLKIKREQWMRAWRDAAAAALAQ